MESGTRSSSPVNRRLFWLSLALYAVYGVTATVFGAALPRIITDFHWSYLITGIVLAAVSVGALVVSIAVARVRRVGTE